MNKQNSQNAVSLEARRVKIIKLDTKILVDIKIYYLTFFRNFILAQFSALIYALKINHDNYKKNSAAEYYKIVSINTLYDKFINLFFKKLK